MMDNLILPNYGSVVIIDDQFKEALPLMNLFSSKGIPYTYYSGKTAELPENPKQKIRIAIVDIQLFGPSDPHTYSQNILRLLERIIPENNGPYLLLIWSTVDVIYADTLENEVNASNYPRRPVFTLRLEKSDYFEKITENEGEEIYSSIQEIIETRFSEDDLTFLENTINSKYLPKQINIAKPNALELITNKIKEQLTKANCFSLFVIWENLINISSGQTVNSFTSINNTDEYWDDNLKEMLYKLAHAQVGKNISNLSNLNFVKNIYKTINQYFVDLVESNTGQIQTIPDFFNLDKDKISFCKKIDGNIYKIVWKGSTGKYTLFIDNIGMPPNNPKDSNDIKSLKGWGGNPVTNSKIESLIKEYIFRSPEINTKLLIDGKSPLDHQPGNVYYKPVRGLHKRYLLENYFEPEILRKDTNNNYIISDLSKIYFIELEITPICDYAQNKWKKFRLLPGILIPEDYGKYIKKNFGDSFYKVPSVLKLYKGHYYLIFDFGLIKSSDFPIDLKPEFSIKKELLSDIVSRFTSHANRIGLTYVV